MESSGTDDKTAAKKVLRKRETAVDDGLPIGPKVGKIRFEEAADDLKTEYRVNARRSYDELERRIRLHLQPYFGSRKLASITTADVRAFTAERQESGASNGESNRELATLKRMYTLAMQAGKLLRRAHIPMLKERNVRTGFFEREQFEAVRAKLPTPVQPVVTFAYLTGWRVPSEVLTLQWRQVDFEAGEVRLDPHTTKNDDGRVFPLTDDLRALLEAQHAERERLKQAGQIVPWVFWRMVAKGRGGPKQPKRIVAFTKAWKVACRAAGCPGRIPHDFRRTAVRNMIRRGVPERVMMQLAGHKTRSIFDRYHIVSEGDLTTAAAQLNGQMGSATGSADSAVGAAARKPRKKVREFGGAARI